MESNSYSQSVPTEHERWKAFEQFREELRPLLTGRKFNDSVADLAAAREEREKRV